MNNQERDPRIDRMLRSLPLGQTPPEVRAHTLHAVEELAAAEPVSVPGLSFPRLAVAFLIGIVASFAALGSLGVQLPLASFAPVGVSACGVWWTGAFGLAFAMILGRYRVRGMYLGTIAGLGAVAVGFLFVSTAFCPKLHLLSLWEASAAGQLVLAVGGRQANHLAFGFLYALLPTLLVGLVFGRRLSREWLRNGVLLAVGFLVLLLPALTMTSCCLPTYLGLVLAAGTIAGSFGGAITGLGFHRLRLAA